MTELYRSTFEEMNLRRGSEDAETLFDMLATHGEISLADDPSKEEILKAREQLASQDEKAQAEAEKEQAKAEKEAGADKDAENERDALQRKASLPVAEEPEEPKEPEGDEEK